MDYPNSLNGAKWAKAYFDQEGWDSYPGMTDSLARWFDEAIERGMGHTSSPHSVTNATGDECSTT